MYSMYTTCELHSTLTYDVTYHIYNLYHILGVYHATTYIM